MWCAVVMVAAGARGLFTARTYPTELLGTIRTQRQPPPPPALAFSAVFGDGMVLQRGPAQARASTDAKSEGVARGIGMVVSWVVGRGSCGCVVQRDGYSIRWVAGAWKWLYYMYCL